MVETQILAACSGADAEAIRAVAASLRGGGLAVIPTETVYGLAGDERVPGVMERMFEAKGRDRDKPIAFLAAETAAIEACGAELDGTARRLAERFWPGPLTLVLKRAARWEGFRVPAHEVALALLREMGGLLRVTSANLSGEPPARTVAEALRTLGNRVDVALDGGPVETGVPSTVAKVEDGRIRILRQGAIAETELRRHE